jgi:hypothetical protein
MYVKRQLSTLTARGETTQDLVINLFKGYRVAKCEQFVLFIGRKKDAYIEGAIDFTPETLMSTAEQHYQSLKLEGTWNAVSPHEQHVLALTAQIEALKKNRTPRKERVGTPGKQLQPSERFTGEQAWKAVAPKNGEAHAKPVGKLIFHWCPHHGFWTVHKPEDCTLGTPTKTIDATKTGPKAPPTIKTKKTLTFAQAATAVMNDEDEDEETDE